MSCSLNPIITDDSVTIEIVINEEPIRVPSLLFMEASNKARELSTEQFNELGFKDADIAINRREFAKAMFAIIHVYEINPLSEFNKYGEPTLNSVFKHLALTNNPYTKLANQQIAIDSNKRLSFKSLANEGVTLDDTHFYNLTLSSLFILNMDSLRRLKNTDTYSNGKRKTIKSELLKYLNTYKDTQKAEHQFAINNYEKDIKTFTEDYNKVDSKIYNSFIDYLKQTYGVVITDITETSNIDKTDIDVDEAYLAERWDDGAQSKTNRINTVSSITKLEIAKLIANTPNYSKQRIKMYITEPYDINSIWARLITAHLHDTTLDAVKNTLGRLAQDNSIFQTILDKFNNAENNVEADVHFRSNYMGSINMAVIPSTKLLIEGTKISEFTNNRDSFANSVLFDIYQNTITNNISSQNYSVTNKGTKTTKNIEISFIESIIVNNIKKYNLGEVYSKLEYLGLDITKYAIESYLQENREDYDGALAILVQDINRVINEINNYISNRSDRNKIDFNEKGALNRLAYIGSYDFNTAISLSYLDVKGSLNYSPQFDSFLTKSFRGLVKFGKVDTDEVIRVFEKYTLTPDFANDNFLWHDKTQHYGYGIFESELDKTGIKVIKKDDKGKPVINEDFVKAISLFQFNGSTSNHNGMLYADILNDNWAYTQITFSMLGKQIIPTSDSARSYGLNIPLMQIEGLYNRDNSLNNQHSIFKSLRNIVVQNINDYFIAKSKVFKQDNTLYDLKDLKKLHTIRDVQLDKQNNIVAIKNGVPTGMAFHFPDLSYKVNSNSYTFENHIIDSLGITAADILSLDKTQMETLIDSFVANHIHTTKTNILAEFESISDILLKQVTTVKRNVLGTDNRTIAADGTRFLVNRVEYIPLSKEVVIKQAKVIYKERAKQAKLENRSYASEEVMLQVIENELKNNRASEFFNTKEFKDGYDLSILEAALNTIINSVSINNIFIGKLNEYKNALDWNKRASMIVKNGFHATVNEGTDEFRVLVVKDITKDSNMLDLLKDYLPAKSMTALDKLANTTDGFSIITSNHYKTLMTNFGRFSKDLERLFDNITKGQTFNPSELNTLIEQLKLFGTSRELSQIERQLEDGSTVIDKSITSIQLKDSTGILFDKTFKGTRLEELYNKMKQRGIDQISFASAVKVSGVIPIDIEEFLSDANPNLDDSIIKMKFSNMVIQQDTPSHILDEYNKLSNQLQKRILEGINFDEAIYSLDGTKYTGTELAKIFHDLMGSNFEEASYDLLRELGVLDGYNIRLDSNGHIDVNTKLLQEALEKYVKNDTNNQNSLDSVKISEEGTPNLPFSSPLIYNHFVSILLSKLTKTVIDYKVDGMHVPIMPNLLMNPSNISEEAFRNSTGIERSNIVDNKSLEEYVTYDAQFIAEVKLGGTYEKVIELDKAGKEVTRKQFVPNKGFHNSETIYGREDYQLRSENGYDDNGNLIYPADVIINPWKSDFYTNLVVTKDVSYTDENGNITTDRRSYVDINRLSNEARTMLSTRIPHEGKQSTTIFKVIGFLNTGASQATFPFTMMTRTGWDFDIDTVYIQYKALEYINGEYGVVKFDNKYNKANQQKYVERVYADTILDIKSGYGEYIDEPNLLNNELLKGSHEYMVTLDYTNVETIIDNLKEVEKDVRRAFAKITITEFSELSTNTEYLKLNDTLTKIAKLKSELISVTKNKTKFNNAIQERTSIMKIIDKANKNSIKETITDELETKYKNLGIKFQNIITSINDIVAKDNIQNQLTNIQDTLESIKYFNIDNIEDIKSLIHIANYIGNEKTKTSFLYAKSFYDIVEDNIDVFVTSKTEEFKRLDNNLQNTKEARGNKLLDIFISILGNIEHASELNKPNETNNIEAVSKEVNEAYGKSNKGLNPNNLEDQITLNNLNMNVRKLKAFSVSWDNLMSVTGFLKAKLGEGVKRTYYPGELGEITKTQLHEAFGNNFNIFSEGKHVTFKKAPEDLTGYTIKVSDTNLNNNNSNNWKDISGERLSIQASEFSANVFDAVKKPMGFNMNADTHSIMRLLSSGASSSFNGKTWNRFRYGMLFIHQPVIVDAIKQLNKLRIENAYVKLETGLEEAVRKEHLAIYELFVESFKETNEFQNEIARIEKTKNLPYKYRNDQVVLTKDMLLSITNKYPNLQKYLEVSSKYQLKENTGTDNISGKSIQTIYFGENELKDFITNRNIPNDSPIEKRIEQHLQQLHVVQMFNAYLKIANRVTKLGPLFKTENSVGPTFNEVNSRDINLADAYMDRAQFANELNKLSIQTQPGDMYKFIMQDKVKLEGLETTEDLTIIPKISKSDIILRLEEFDTTSNITERKEFVDRILGESDTKHPIMVDGKSIIEVVFPGAFTGYTTKSTDANELDILTFNQSYKNSAYGNIEAKYQYGHYLASILFDKIFIQQNPIFKSVINTILKKAGLSYNSEIRSELAFKLINYDINKSPIFKHITNEEWNRILGVEMPLVAEVTIDGVKSMWSDIISKDTITEAEFKEWLKLSTASKIHIIKNTPKYKTYINRTEFRNSHVLKTLRVAKLSKKTNYRRIEYKTESENANIAIHSFDNMYMSENPYLANTARDLILYTYRTKGFEFGFNLTKAIPVKIFYNQDYNNTDYDNFISFINESVSNDADKILENTKFIGDYTKVFKALQQIVNKLGSNLDYSEAVSVIHRQMYSNFRLNPLTPKQKVIDANTKSGKVTAHFNEAYLIKLEDNKTVEVLIETRGRLVNSKYSSAQYITKKSKSGTVLYRRFEHIYTVPSANDIVIFYPVNKLENNEWSEFSSNPINNITDVSEIVIKENLINLIGTSKLDTYKIGFKEEVKKSDTATTELGKVDYEEDVNKDEDNNSEILSSSTESIESDESTELEDLSEYDTISTINPKQLYFNKEQIITNDSVSSTINTIVNDSDTVIFIGNTNTFIGKQFKSKASNLIIIDPSKNAQDEAFRILEELKDSKVVNISGNNISELGFDQDYSNNWVSEFMHTIAFTHPNIELITTYGNNGIGYSVDRYEGSIQQKTYITEFSKNFSIILNNTPSVSVSTIIDYKEKLKLTSNTILETIALMDNIIRQADIKSIYYKNINTLAEASKALSTDMIRDNILNQELTELRDALEILAGTEKGKGAVTNMYMLVKQIKLESSNVVYDDLFRNKVAREEYYAKLSLALQLVSRLVDYSKLKKVNMEDLYTYTLDANDNKVFSQVDIDEFKDNYEKLNKYIATLKGYGNNAITLKGELEILSKKLIVVIAIRTSSNPKIATVHNKIIDQLLANKLDPTQQIDISITDGYDEISNTIDFIFEKGNVDLTWAQTNFDSAFKTYSPFNDNITKQYQHMQGSNKIEELEMYDKYNALLKAYDESLLSDTGKRREALAKFVTDRGGLIADYDYLSFIDTWRKLKRDLAKLHRDLVGTSTSRIDVANYLTAAKKVTDEWIVNETDNNTIYLTPDQITDIENITQDKTNRQKSQYYITNGIYILPKSKYGKQWLKVQPNNKFINNEYTSLSNKDKTFVEDVRTIFKEILLRTKPSYIPTPDFLPFIDTISSGKAIKGTLGVQGVADEHSYVQISNDIGYFIEASTVTRPEKYTLLKQREIKNSESFAEYTTNLLSELNTIYKKLKNKAIDDFEFKSIDDIQEYNEAAARLNITASTKTMNKDLSDIMKGFTSEMYHIKTVNDFMDLYHMATYHMKNTVKVSTVNTKGKTYIDGVMSRILGRAVPHYESAENSNLRQSLDRLEKLLNNAGRVNSGWAQTAAVVGRIGSMTFMWGNYLGAIKNVAAGLINMTITAHGDYFVDKSALGWALSHYPTSELLTSLNPQFEHEYSNDKRLALIKHFDYIFQDARDGRMAISGSGFLVKVLSGLDNLMYSPSNITEHYMQYSMLLAMAKSNRVIEGRIYSKGDFVNKRIDDMARTILTPKQIIELEEYIKNKKDQQKDIAQAENHTLDFVGLITNRLTEDQRKSFLQLKKVDKKEITEAFNKLPSLYDIIDVENGRLSTKDIILNENALTNFGSKVMDVNQSMHGIYDTINRMALQDSMMGELMVQFRKWMRPTFKRFFGPVFGETRFNEATGTYDDGIYSPIFRLLNQPFKEYKYDKSINPAEASIRNIFSGYLRLVTQFKWYYGKMAPHEQASVRMFAAHITGIIGFSAALFMLGRLKDDEEPSMAMATFMYEVTATYSELIQPVPIYGWWSTISLARQQSMVGEKVLVDLEKVLRYGILELAPNDLVDQDNLIYDRGVYKGRSKFDVALQKVSPLIRQKHKQEFIPSNTAFYKMYNPFL